MLKFSKYSFGHLTRLLITNANGKDRGLQQNSVITNSIMLHKNTFVHNFNKGKCPNMNSNNITTVNKTFLELSLSLPNAKINRATYVINY